MSMNLKSLKLALSMLEIELSHEPMHQVEPAEDDGLVNQTYEDHQFQTPPDYRQCTCEWCQLVSIHSEFLLKVDDLFDLLYATRPTNNLPAPRNANRWGQIMVHGQKYEVLPFDDTESQRTVQVLSADEHECVVLIDGIERTFPSTN